MYTYNFKPMFLILIITHFLTRCIFTINNIIKTENIKILNPYKFQTLAGFNVIGDRS